MPDHLEDRDYDIHSVSGKLCTAVRTARHRAPRAVALGGASALGAALEVSIPFERNLPVGLMPVALAQDIGQEPSGRQGRAYGAGRPAAERRGACLFSG